MKLYGAFCVLGTGMEEKILSVGIDIGTSTTQVIFSEIIIENIASVASVPRIRVVDKRLIYAGEIHMTPLLSSVEIDAEQVGEIVRQEYSRSGFTADNIQTGAVIITGETARKRNAATVLQSLSGLAGDFVVAVAGPALEGIIAGKGAGVHIHSKTKGAVVANIDIGGGTTNIAVFDNGEPVATSCLDIGGRLITFSKSDGKITFISKKLRQFADAEGIAIREGEKPGNEQIKNLTERMADVLDQILGVKPAAANRDILVTDHPLTLAKPIEFISFSGGVADCIATADHNDNPFLYGDIGFFLGRAIKRAKAFTTLPKLTAKETIRATVVGAGTHTTEISGSTIDFVEELLPLQNLPVVRLNGEEESAPFAEWPAFIEKKMAWLNLDDGAQTPALAFSGRKTYNFQEMQELAGAISEGIERSLPVGSPLVIVVEQDFGKALGQALRMLAGQKRQVICVDSIKVSNGDYIDIGRGLSRGKVVPVVVKTLVFGY